MVDIDIFVHPICPTLDNMFGKQSPKVLKSIEDYLEHVGREMVRSSNPILIKLPVDAPRAARRLEEATLFSTLAQDRYVHSYGFNTREAFYPSGNISNNDWEKFVELLKNVDTKSNIRIHGAYFGRCPRSLALQMFAYLKYNFQMFKEKDKIKYRDLFLLKLLETTGVFRRSGIKYGVVFSRENTGEIYNPEAISEKPSITRPFGNLNYQLTDSETRVYSTGNSQQQNL